MMTIFAYACCPTACGLEDGEGDGGVVGEGVEKEEGVEEEEGDEEGSCR